VWKYPTLAKYRLWNSRRGKNFPPDKERKSYPPLQPASPLFEWNFCNKGNLAVFRDIHIPFINASPAERVSAQIFIDLTYSPINLYFSVDWKEALQTPGFAPIHFRHKFPIAMRSNGS
jgi:hypothetical protein